MTDTLILSTTLKWMDLAIPWQACFDEAWHAYQSDCFPIGAVITDQDGTIVSRGRNAINSSLEVPKISRHPLAHAELNALVSFDIDSVNDHHACTLWTLVEPCPLCLGALYMTGIRNVHYAARDPFAGSMNMLGSTPYLSRKPIKSEGPEDNLLEDLILGINIEAMLRLTGDESHPVFDGWEEGSPMAYAFGLCLMENGKLREMREYDSKCSTSFEYLSKQYKEFRNSLKP